MAMGVLLIGSFMERNLPWCPLLNIGVPYGMRK